MISRPVRTAVRGEQGEEMSEGQLIMEGPPPPHRTSSARGSDPSQAVLPLNLNASFSKEPLFCQGHCSSLPLSHGWRAKHRAACFGISEF